MVYISSYNPNNRYLIQRGRVFHFSIRYGNKIFRQSLKTDCFITAKEIVRKVINTIKGARVEKDVLKAIIDDYIESTINTVTAYLYPRSEQGIKAIAQHKQIFGESEEFNYHLHNSSADLQEVKMREKQFPNFREYKVQELMRPVDLKGFERGHAHSEREFQLLKSLREMLAESMGKDDLIQTSQILNTLKNTFELETITTKTAEQAKDNTPKIVDAIERYIADEDSYCYKQKDNAGKPINPKTVKSRKVYLEVMKICWDEMTLGEIGGRTIDEFFEMYSRFPKRHKNPWLSETLEECIEASREERVPDEQRVSKSLTQLKTTLNLFFEYWFDKHVIDKNPMKESRFKGFTKVGSRGAYNCSEIKSLELYCTSGELNAVKVAILMQAYSGMRNSEITTITADKIRTHKEGFMYFDCQGTKTDNAVRDIPVHQKLIDYGVIEWIKSGEKMLEGKDISQKYDRLSVKLGLPRESRKGEPLSFYSLRHSFATGLTNNNVSGLLIEDLMGHAHEGIKRVYIDQAGLIKLNDAVQKLSYNYD